jgi:hypothetical protein
VGKQALLFEKRNKNFYLFGLTALPAIILQWIKVSWFFFSKKNRFLFLKPRVSAASAPSPR